MSHEEDDVMRPLAFVAPEFTERRRQSPFLTALLWALWLVLFGSGAMTVGTGLYLLYVLRMKSVCAGCFGTVLFGSLFCIATGAAGIYVLIRFRRYMIRG